MLAPCPTRPTVEKAMHFRHLQVFGFVAVLLLMAGVADRSAAADTIALPDLSFTGPSVVEPGTTTFFLDYRLPAIAGSTHASFSFTADFGDGSPVQHLGSFVLPFFGPDISGAVSFDHLYAPSASNMIFNALFGMTSEYFLANGVSLGAPTTTYVSAKIQVTPIPPSALMLATALLLLVMLGSRAKATVAPWRKGAS
jgi:hypothetical protein